MSPTGRGGAVASRTICELVGVTLEETLEIRCVKIYLNLYLLEGSLCIPRGRTRVLPLLTRVGIKCR